MLIEATYDNAKKLEKDLKSIASTSVLAEAASKCISDLIDITKWYDRNQKSFIKTINILIKENRKLKELAMSNLVNNMNFSACFDNFDKEVLMKYAKLKFGGDNDDPS